GAGWFLLGEVPDVSQQVIVLQGSIEHLGAPGRQGRLECGGIPRGERRVIRQIRLPRCATISWERTSVVITEDRQVERDFKGPVGFCALECGRDAPVGDLRRGFHLARAIPTAVAGTEVV